MGRLLLATALAGSGVAVYGLGAPLFLMDDSWLQWGGAKRNFVLNAPPLAAAWPPGGPRVLWDRSLGEGHSAVLVDGNRLYTMYRYAGLLSMVRRTQSETIAAIDAATGKTLWEHTYDSSTSGLVLENGAGPHSTPLIVGDTLFAIGSRTEFFALDKNTGQVRWQHDLVKEFGAPQDGRGFSPSPIAYRDTVIVLAGAKGGAAMAFSQRTGAVAWRNGDYPTAPASPILITVNGQEQIVISGENEMLGIDPNNGGVLWRHPHKTQWGLNISTPVWGPDNLLFVSAAYNNGARLLKLEQAAGKTAVQEQWYQNRMRTHIGTVIRIGDFFVGSSGDFGPCPTVAVDAKTGQVLWQNREFARSTFLYADGKLIILDEDGTLGLAAPTRQGLNVLTRASVLSSKAWTVPTLVGTKLYVRDRARMKAFELGR
ncbi:MAG TPA: PQQ-binding-like beta-propeller repeat protein [Vicinamibacterales bacterium]|nr:PQQ-binding-like beta-propeller repeat protein [Vicinamibacterales bacterium]